MLADLVNFLAIGYKAAMRLLNLLAAPHACNSNTIGKSQNKKNSKESNHKWA